MKNTRHKILLVEDDKLDQMAFRQLLEDQQLPYDCTIAGSVSEAQNILLLEQFDIVISDYSLGDGTAFDVLKSVKNIPVIVVTGTGNEEVAVQAWRAGAYDYLTKDIQRSYLKAVPITVENALRHKRAEEKLQLLSGAIMSTNDSVYITDMNDKIIFVNKAFCKTYGYKAEDVLGKDSRMLWIGKFLNANTRSVFQTRSLAGTWEVGFYHQRKDGSIFPVSLSRSMIKDSNGDRTAAVGVVRDITEHILVEDELRGANRKLKQQYQQKSELAIMVSEALSSLLARENILDIQTQDNGAGEPLERAKRIIADFLDISQIDAGKMKLQPTQFDLCSAISDVLEALSPLTSEKTIELESSLPDSELIVSADRNRITQSLTILVRNSIDSSNANGHVKVLVSDIGSEIIVEIQDDAPTIESGSIDEILNCVEYTKEQPPCRKERDLSLGLPIAKKLVEMHGGCVWVESADAGQGNNFCLSLPKPHIRPTLPTSTVAAAAR
jgi:PAS domain S-box-containing protein